MSGLLIEKATERSAALRKALAERVVIADGAMGTMLQAAALTLADFEGPMRDNLAELNDRGIAERRPVLLGGAALTRAYVEQDLAELFAGEVTDALVVHHPAAHYFSV